jgi:hypothetical protein
MQVNEANRLIHEGPGTPLENWQKMRAQMELYEKAAQGDTAARQQVKQLEAQATDRQVSKANH